MSESAKNIREPFFIASNNGNVSSEHVVKMEAEATGTNTRLSFLRGGDYYYQVLVAAPLAVVEQIFAEHGYKFINADDLKKRSESAAPHVPAPV